MKLALFARAHSHHHESSSVALEGHEAQRPSDRARGHSIQHHKGDRQGAHAVEEFTRARLDIKPHAQPEAAPDEKPQQQKEPPSTGSNDLICVMAQPDHNKTTKPSIHNNINHTQHPHSS